MAKWSSYGQELSEDKYTQFEDLSTADLDKYTDQVIAKAQQFSANGETERLHNAKNILKDLQREKKIREYLEKDAEMSADDDWLTKAAKYIDRKIRAAGDSLGAQEIGAGIESIFTGDSFNDELDEEYILGEAYRRKSKANNEGISDNVAEIAAWLIPSGKAAQWLGLTVKGGSKLKKVAKGAGLGAAEAAAYSMTGPGTMQERFDRAGEAVPWGVGFGALVPAVGPVLGSIARNPGAAGAATGGTSAAGAETYDQLTDPKRDFNPANILIEGAAGAATGAAAGKALKYGGGKAADLLGDVVDTARQTASRTLAGSKNKTAGFGGPLDAAQANLDERITRSGMERKSNIAGAGKSIIWGELQNQISQKLFGGKGWGSAGRLQAAGGRRAFVREAIDLALTFMAQRIGYQPKFTPEVREAVASLKNKPTDEAINMLRQMDIITEEQASAIRRIPEDATPRNINSNSLQLKQAQAAAEKFGREGRFAYGGSVDNYAIGGIVGKFVSPFGRRMYDALLRSGKTSQEADRLASAAEAKQGGLLHTQPQMNQPNPYGGAIDELRLRRGEVQNPDNLHTATPEEALKEEAQMLVHRREKNPHGLKGVQEHDLKTWSKKRLQEAARKLRDSKDEYQPIKNRRDFEVVNWAEENGHATTIIDASKHMQQVTKHVLELFNIAQKKAFDENKRSGGKFGRELRRRFRNEPVIPGSNQMAQRLRPGEQAIMDITPSGSMQRQMDREAVPGVDLQNFDRPGVGPTGWDFRGEGIIPDPSKTRRRQQSHAQTKALERALMMFK